MVQLYIYYIIYIYSIIIKFILEFTYHYLGELLMGVRKNEKPFKIGNRFVSAVAYCSLLRAGIRVTLKNTLDIYYYFRAMLTVTLLALFVMHPWILLAVLVRVNVIGNIAINLACISVLMVDFALCFVGGVVVAYMRVNKE